MLQNVCISGQEKKRNIGVVSQLAALVEKGGQRPCLLWHQNQHTLEDFRSLYFGESQLFCTLNLSLTYHLSNFKDPKDPK